MYPTRSPPTEVSQEPTRYRYSYPTDEDCGTQKGLTDSSKTYSQLIVGQTEMVSWALLSPAHVFQNIVLH